MLKIDDVKYQVEYIDQHDVWMLRGVTPYGGGNIAVADTGISAELPTVEEKEKVRMALEAYIAKQADA